MTGQTKLTDAQAQAVETIDGPLLVLAGPGSGKTRVITQRIARMLEQGISDHQILAITFTNKAASEMANRVARVAPGNRVWISTFHRFCSYLLRRNSGFVGLQPNFSILDTSDQKTVVRQSLSELDIDSVHYPPARIVNRISRAKNDLLSPDDFNRLQADRIGDHFSAVVARVYPEYQRRLLQANSVDFDDLLLLTIQLLRDNEEIRRMLDDRYRYVLVDEYQDTNQAQYEIVSALSVDHRNLCATGDPDQSIYGWRGARIENILRFEREYDDAKVVRLEENFRSTSQILEAADKLIRHNKNRKHKELLTANPDGPEVRLAISSNGREEAEMIAAEISDQVRSGLRKWSDFAVFYRVNSLSRQLEIALTRANVPFQIAAGVAFYDRAEVKDLVCYLRLVNNPRDNVAFLRIVNTPARGIGKTTLRHLMSEAAKRNLDLLTVARTASEIPAVTARASKALSRFVAAVDHWTVVASQSVEKLLAAILEETAYIDGWMESTDEQSQQRLANVHELISAARQFDNQPENGGLEMFLESCSLTNDVDAIADDSGTVTLMTLHAAKGLEFPAVYVVGVEENLIPHERSIRSGDPNDIEEERRLLFVGITRAEEELTLTQTYVREQHGRTLHTIPSEFLANMNLSSASESGASLKESLKHFIDDFPAEDSTFQDEFAELKDKKRKKKNVPTELKLMRGSDLLADKSSDSSIELPRGFGIGMQVRHPRYGRGTVVSVGGMSRHRTVTVEFENDGRSETFVASKCPLQPIGEG